MITAHSLRAPHFEVTSCDLAHNGLGVGVVLPWSLSAAHAPPGRMTLPVGAPRHREAGDSGWGGRHTATSSCGATR